MTFEVIPNYDSRSLFAGGQVIGANRDVRVETFDSPRYVIDPNLDSETDLLPSALKLAVDGLRDAVSCGRLRGSGDRGGRAAHVLRA